MFSVFLSNSPLTEEGLNHRNRNPQPPQKNLTTYVIRSCTAALQHGYDKYRSCTRHYNKTTTTYKVQYFMIFFYYLVNIFCIFGTKYCINVTNAAKNLLCSSLFFTIFTIFTCSIKINFTEYFSQKQIIKLQKLFLAYCKLQNKTFSSDTQLVPLRVNFFKLKALLQHIIQTE